MLPSPPPKRCRTGLPSTLITPARDGVVKGMFKMPLKVIEPAEKLPAPSLRTIVFGVLLGSAFETTVALGAPVTSPAKLGKPDAGKVCPGAKVIIPEEPLMLSALPPPMITLPLLIVIGELPRCRGLVS